MQSVLDSDYEDVSVVVVDDGSTDGTVVALRHSGSRVHVVSQENTGKAAANVKIADQRGVLGWVQRLEYAEVHRLKQGYAVFNCEYVIGGVGSMFRTSIVRACGCTVLRGYRPAGRWEHVERTLTSVPG